MSETINTKDVRNDEIDLFDLFKRMKQSINSMIKALGRAFLIACVFLIRRWLPLGLSIALGIGASYLFKMTSEPSYTADLVLRANAVANTSDMISYLNRLHKYCIEDNTVPLANALSLDSGQLNNINDINAFWIIDMGRDGIPDFVDFRNNHNIYDTINIRMQDRFVVRAQIKSPSELINLRNGLIKFINSDSLFQQRNRVRLRQNLELLTRLDYDIRSLDSLQKIKLREETSTRQSQSSGQIIFMQDQKTQLVYTDIYNLYSRKQSLESERDLYKDIVTVLSEFAEPAKRDNGGFYYGKYLIPTFFFITFLILIIMANRKKLEEVYKKY